MPAKDDLATLVLIDEVLMYAREKVGLDESWLSRLQNFFQYLTQAATKVDRCAIVASLLATDVTKSDGLGKRILGDLSDVFRREKEEGVQPVVKEDVAEVLRRRFFKPESIKDRESFRQHVVAALKGVTALDEQTKKERKAAEDRYVSSYPFHPDLTEVLYSKWTQLEGFQRTRGVLRTFALALRESEKWDASPLVGPNVFLNTLDKQDLSEALRELSSIAGAEVYEGKRQEWTAILQGELAKARAIQTEFPGLDHREVEQAVISTFIHSQPVGQKATAADLMCLLGHSRPDKIELEKGLLRWTEISWFLDEGAIAESAAAPSEPRALPKTWRLGSKPNLRQMHNEESQKVSPDLIDTKLIDAISEQKKLTAGASAAGTKVHMLPNKPNDIEDDGEFHFAVLGPKAASASGKPSAEAVRYIEETTAPDRPRVYRNAVVLAVPSREGVEAIRTAIRDYLGWEEVAATLKKQQGGDMSKVDPLRAELLAGYVKRAKNAIPDAVRQAYSIVVTVSNKNDVQAFKVSIGDGSDPLFTTIKSDNRSRIQDTPVSADALLPEGPYNLWREGETSRRVKDLVGAFAQFPHLPKMLRRREILETLALGAKEGFFVLQATRPDRSVRTVWRQEPGDADTRDASLELVLPEAATLTEISPNQILPGVLPGLWPEPSEITVKSIIDYFAGGNVVKIQREGYEEPFTVPKAERSVAEQAVSQAIESGKLWLVSGVASIMAEPIPAGVLSDDAILRPPPNPIAATDVLPDNLPSAWQDKQTTALGISTALAQKAAIILPWPIVRETIDGAIRARMLEKTDDSGPWPCEVVGAQAAKFRMPTGAPVPSPGPGPQPPTPGTRVAEAELRPNEIQDLADVVGELAGAAVGHQLKFGLRIELGGEPSDEIVQKMNRFLQGVSEGLALR